MKLQLLFMACGVLGLNAAPLLGQQKVSLSMDNVGVIEVIKEVERQSEQSVFYNNTALRGLRNVSVRAREEAAIDVLNSVLSGTGFDCRAVDNHLVISQHQQPERVTVTGMVQNGSGHPIDGATVRAAGSNRATRTGADGRFSISVDAHHMRLIVSYVGMKTQEAAVVNPGSPLTVVMEEDVVEIDDVVVTGVFNKLRESLPGAITEISGVELRQNFSRNVMQTLSLLEPSLRIIADNNAGSNPNVLPEITLRGRTTMLDIDDLDMFNSIVDDGVTGVKKTDDYLALNAPLFVVDGFEMDYERFTDINVNDIKSVTILKEAGATSLYGARGANGVIVVTTYRPEPGKLNVTYSGSLKWEIADLSTYDRLSAKEKLEFEHDYGVWEASAQIPDAPEQYAELMSQIEGGRVFDWLKAPVRNGVGQMHNIGIAGGSEQWRYRLSLSNDNTRGVMKGSDRNMFNGNMSLAYADERLSFSQQLTVGVNDQKTSPYGAYFDYVNINPYYYPWDENGEPVPQFQMITRPQYRMNNPIYDALVGNIKTNRYTELRSNTNLSIAITDYLRASAMLGLSRRFDESNTTYKPSDSRFGGSYNTRGRVDIMNGKENGWRTGLGLDFMKVFNEKHTVSVSFSAQMAESVTDEVSWMTIGFLNDNFVHPGMGLGYPPNPGHPTGTSQPVHMLSFIGTANYYFDKRFFADASFSRDGSSSFGSLNRYGTFYSAGGGWNVGNENFIKDNLSFVERLRLTYSYGVSGNAAFGPQEVTQIYSMIPDVYTGNEIGYTLSGQSNPSLKWQSTFTHDVGVELDLWKNDLLTFQFHYYTKRTENTVNTIFIPLSHGFEQMVANIGTTRNEGYEYNFGSRLINNAEKRFYLSVNFMLSRNKNTIVKISEAFKDYLGHVESLNQSIEMMRYREGKSMDAIYGLQTIGVDPATGERWYKRPDGSITLQPLPQDLVYLGDRQGINGTLSLNVQYRGLRVTAAVQFEHGGVTENRTELNVENLNISANLDRRVLDDVWIKPGDKARYKNRLTGPSYANNMFVHKNNILRGTAFNVSYDLPEKWVSRIGMRYLSIGVDYSDLFYLSSIRRERGMNYPFSRNPNFRLNCAF